VIGQQAGHLVFFVTSFKDSISLISNCAIQATVNLRHYRTEPQNLRHRIPGLEHIPCITGKRQPLPHRLDIRACDAADALQELFVP